MEFEFILDHKVRRVRLENTGEGFRFTEGDLTLSGEIMRISENLVLIRTEEGIQRVYLARDKQRRLVYLEGREFVMDVPSQDADSWAGSEERSLEAELKIKAPMPGKVIKISVRENDEVRKNQTLAIVEAMKMENEIKSGIDGVVKAVFAAVGDLVDSDTPLIELEKKA